MAQIPVAIYQKAILLALIGRTPQGEWGAKRLQKHIFLIEKVTHKAPFAFEKEKKGPFSREVANLVTELGEAGYLRLTETPVAKGAEELNLRKMVVRGWPGEMWELCAKVLESWPGAERAWMRFSKMRTAELVALAYAEPGVEAATKNEPLIARSVGDLVDVPTLSEDDAEDLAVSFAVAPYLTAISEASKTLASSSA